MKAAFTYLELVIVIVLIGILALISINRLDRDHLYEAADQLSSHLRYAQHLSTIDDKYDATNEFYYKENWQLEFNNVSNVWTYTVFSDNDYDGDPDLNDNEIASNPISQNQVLSGGYANTMIGTTRMSKKLNLTKSYGIKDINISSNCSISGSKRIAFDYLGRPLVGNIRTYQGNYNIEDTSNPNRFLLQNCIIELCIVQNCTTATTEEKVTITIYPQTGFVNII